MPAAIDRAGPGVRELNDRAERELDEVRDLLRAGDLLAAHGVASVLARTLDDLFLADRDATKESHDLQA